MLRSGFRTLQRGAVAQLEEYLNGIQGVVGSNPISSTNISGTGSGAGTGFKRPLTALVLVGNFLVDQAPQHGLFARPAPSQSPQSRQFDQHPCKGVVFVLDVFSLLTGGDFVLVRDSGKG